MPVKKSTQKLRKCLIKLVSIVVLAIVNIAELPVLGHIIFYYLSHIGYQLTNPTTAKLIPPHLVSCFVILRVYALAEK